MICRNPNCAMENSDDLVFCKYCGRRLKELKNNSKRPIQIIAGVAGVIVILLIGKAIFSGVGKVTAPDATKDKGNITQPIVNGTASYKFTFVRSNGTAKEIFINNADGTTSKVTNSNKENLFPSFSPDGSKIAFERKEDRNSYIYIMNSDGTGEKKLAEGHAPTWSNDGGKILFYNKDSESISNFIYSIKTDGTGLVKETKTQDSYFMSRYSTDGQRVAITKKTSSGFGIYTVKTDFTPGRTLFENSKKIDQPSWSEDSNKLAYAFEDSKLNNDIYTLDLNGNNTKLVATPANEYNPTWTNDGKIIFTRDEVSGSNVYVINADGSNETLLVRDAAFASVAAK